MEIPLYLAMTAAEFQRVKDLPDPLAWMACHFSSYGTGISNVPASLPPGSMLMLNDRIPINGHDPKLVSKTLCDAAQSLGCTGIVLDFQRTGCDALFDVVQAVLRQAGCPVGVSEPYAADFNCPVLMLPLPPHVSAKEALARQNGREIWLELSAEGTQISVTEEGSSYTSLSCVAFDGIIHSEPELHCHYNITVAEDRVIFQLGRTKEDQAALLETAAKLGVTGAFGLWQELKA